MQSVRQECRALWFVNEMLLGEGQEEDITTKTLRVESSSSKPMGAVKLEMIALKLSHLAAMG